VITCCGTVARAVALARISYLPKAILPRRRGCLPAARRGEWLTFCLAMMAAQHGEQNKKLAERGAPMKTARKMPT
jgi:hypothetical protein